MKALGGARSWRVGLVMFVAGGFAASLLLMLSPATYLFFTDALAWRIGSKSVAQARLEKTLTGAQLHIDSMQSEPGVVWFGDSHLQHFPPSLQSGVVSNFAIGGETAVDMAQRISRYSAPGRARGIVLLSGRNDLQQDAEADVIVRAFSKVLAGLPTTVQLRLVSVPPARESADRVAKRLALNTQLQGLCAARAGCRYVSLEGLAAADGQLLAQYDAGDGVHLNAAGYRLLASFINEL